jgi:hypothetical protein
MALTILAAMTWALAAPSASPIYRPELFTKGTDMREHVLLFCLLGLVTIILVAAPGAVTWALALIE